MTQSLLIQYDDAACLTAASGPVEAPYSTTESHSWKLKLPSPELKAQCGNFTEMDVQKLLFG
jgi:hypothetical protein